MRDAGWVLRELERTLALLSAPAEKQISYIRTNRVHHDELALDFDAVAPVARSLQEQQVLTEGQLKAIDAVNQQLDKMSGPEHDPLWTDQGIGNDPEWEVVRLLAGRALSLLRGHEEL
jgi:hypothetical protein